MAHAHLPSDKNNDSNYVENNETSKPRRGRRLQLYLEDELVRIGEMQNRVARELVFNSEFFTSRFKCGREYTNDLDVVLAVGKDLVQAQLKLTRPHCTCPEDRGRDETDWNSLQSLL